MGSRSNGEQLVIDTLSSVPLDLSKSAGRPMLEHEPLLNDNVMQQLGQLVLAHWDRGDRNQVVFTPTPA